MTFFAPSTTPTSLSTCSVQLSGISLKQIQENINSFIESNKKRTVQSNHNEFFDKKQDLNSTTCARTNVVQLNRSVQIRKQYVQNPDDVLARSVVPLALRKSKWDLDNVPEGLQERIYQLWTFLNMQIESVAAKAISPEERLELCYFRLTEIEQGYSSWLQSNWSWIGHDVDAWPIQFGSDSNRWMTFMTLKKQVMSFSLPRLSLYPFVKNLEDRILKIQLEAPLYFASQFMYPQRPCDTLPPVAKVQVTKLGTKWIHQTIPITLEEQKEFL